jgi:hypothetical protein
MSDRFTPSSRDDAEGFRPGERRGPQRPQGDSRLPAHIMAAVRDTIRAAAATCVHSSRLEASGPYEWLAIVEANDEELYRLLRSYIESCRYADELESSQSADLGPTRLAHARRDASFAKDSIKRSLDQAIASRRQGLADV